MFLTLVINYQMKQWLIFSSSEVSWATAAVARSQQVRPFNHPPISEEFEV